MTVWSQSPRGRAIDLLEPRVDQVDFREIADALAGINRYAGCVASLTQPVSVALHTLIAIEAAPDFAKPYVALHDAPEARLGDQIRPFKLALREMVTARLHRELGESVVMIIDEMHDRHFLTMCTAAGLPYPTKEAWAAVKHADAVALVTERRWFLAPCDLPWHASLETLAPLPRRPRWLPADKAADALYERFCQLLPALRRHAA
jgi:hypothetical protein